MELSSYINLPAASGQENALANFLKTGAQIVQKTEPGTLLWAALQSPDLGTCVIFDTFSDESARDAHFAGEVAAALNANALTLVEGGWDDGVVPNINNASVVAAKVTSAPEKVKLATFIPLTAIAGQEEELANLLTTGAQMVTDSEPQTLYWFALRFGERSFAILDFFADQAGINAHFGGDVAFALQQNATALVEGGWEQGVIDGVKQFNVLALVTQTTQ